MTDYGAIRDWLFQSLSVEAALNEFEADGIALRAAHDPNAVQRVIPLEDFSADIRRASMAALPAYLAFFCLENAVRELIAERLQERRGTSWWEATVPNAVQERVKLRRDKEGVHRWHVSRGATEITYTDFGDLKLIILNNWQDFEDLFPHQNWIVTRLEELEASRNIIAHSNALDERELTRLRVYLQDWTRQVG